MPVIQFFDRCRIIIDDLLKSSYSHHVACFLLLVRQGIHDVVDAVLDMLHWYLSIGMKRIVDHSQ